MSTRHHGHPQAPKQHRVQWANERGIFAVRRRVSPDSYPLLQQIIGELQPELQNASRLFDVKSLGITVIGFSRFDKRHKGIGPPTKDITERVASCRCPIEVRLGALGVYGSDMKGKLGVGLASQELAEEIQKLEDEFRATGFPLRPDPNSDGEFSPHCSLALLDNDKLPQFRDSRTLDRLNHIPGISTAVHQTLVLEPALRE